MIRAIICFNILAVYAVYLAGKLNPKPLDPATGWFDYFMLFCTGLNFLYACVAIWRAKDFEF